MSLLHLYQELTSILTELHVRTVKAAPTRKDQHDLGWDIGTHVDSVTWLSHHGSLTRSGSERIDSFHASCPNAVDASRRVA